MILIKLENCLFAKCVNIQFGRIQVEFGLNMKKMGENVKNTFAFVMNRGITSSQSNTQQ